MSKTANRLKSLGRTIEKNVKPLSNKIKIYIPAGMASASPPLGPTLGQRNLNIATFCKDFNEKTKHIIEGIPLPTTITINSDRSYVIRYTAPPTTFLLKQAAGITRAAMNAGEEVAGKVTLKHIYEIAKIKSEDPVNECKPMEDMCNMIIGTARSCGIQVVKSLDVEEYRKFLEERKLIVEQQKKELQEAREAKMLRATQ